MTRLLKLLIAKSVLDTLLVGAIAVGSYMVAFPPFFHGWGEAIPHAIAGWAVNNRDPWSRVQVQLFIDGTFAGTMTADLPRPDVQAAGWAKDEWHGYSFVDVKVGEGIHEARVYALYESGGGSRLTLQLLGDPIRFQVRADGTFVDVSKVNSKY